jgi:linoleoyl-CoA desaturase
MNNRLRFRPEPDAFYDALKGRVYVYLEGQANGRFADSLFFSKALLLVGLYLICYAVMLWTDVLAIAVISYVLLGPLAILIGINVAHDAAHQAISPKPWVNTFFLHAFDLLGANSYIWKHRHVFAHHAVPNVLGQDADLKQNALLRIFPNDQRRPFHRFQVYYAPLLYACYTLIWLLYRDFRDFSVTRIGRLTFHGHPWPERIKLVLFKLVFAGTMIALPSLFSVLSFGQTMGAFLLMNMAGSMLISLALIPSHVADESLFPECDEHGELPYSWSHHQVMTVIDFATTNRVLNFLFGGFNHHVAHHLFPHVCHVHAQEITKLVKQTTKEFGLPYREETSLWMAYRSHFRLLQRNAVSAEIKQPLHNTPSQVWEANR